ncbi:protein of unknown function (plasmid) [Caballeronia sp. S22]
MQSARALTGRPNWIIFDEAHQLFPDGVNAADAALPEELAPAIFCAAHPARISARLLARVSVFVGVGAGRGRCAARIRACREHRDATRYSRRYPPRRSNRLAA